MNHRNVDQMRSVGNYALDGVSLGKGTFSRVERATHVILKRPVALKIQLKDSINNKGSNSIDFGLSFSMKMAQDSFGYCYMYKLLISNKSSYIC